MTVAGLVTPEDLAATQMAAMLAVRAAAEKVGRQPHDGAAVAALRDAAACLAEVDRCASAIAMDVVRELAGLPRVPVPRQRHLRVIPGGLAGGTS